MRRNNCKKTQGKSRENNLDGLPLSGLVFFPNITKETSDNTLLDTLSALLKDKKVVRQAKNKSK